MCIDLVLLIGYSYQRLMLQNYDDFHLLSITVSLMSWIQQYLLQYYFDEINT